MSDNRLAALSLSGWLITANEQQRGTPVTRKPRLAASNITEETL